MECQHCGIDKPDACVRIDPYSEEIYDEIIEMTLCDACYEDRLDDI